MELCTLRCMEMESKQKKHAWVLGGWMRTHRVGIVKDDLETETDEILKSDERVKFEHRPI